MHLHFNSILAANFAGAFSFFKASVCFSTTSVLIDHGCMGDYLYTIAFTSGCQRRYLFVKSLVVFVLLALAVAVRR
jgi:hypothetical protein